MTTATPENLSDWRELADQLTPDQIADLERCEREYREWTPDVVVKAARNYATENALAALYSSCPIPAGTDAGSWQDGPQPHRFINGPDRIVGNLEISATVAQMLDGSIDMDDSCHTGAPVIYVAENGRQAITLPRALAREFAKAILETDAEIDKWGTEAP